jgi:hypothetical protein
MAGKAKGGAGSTAVYPVLKRLRHDGESYGPGETIELDDGQAAGLITAGVIADRAPEPAADSTTAAGA